MADNVWRKIEENLEKLNKDTAMIGFHPLVAQTKHWASVTPPVYPPEIFLAFIELIRQMGEDVKHGKPVQVVLDQAASRTGAYNQPFWDVNGNIYQFFLNKCREEIEPETPDPKLQLPVVLLVMHLKEAHELLSGAAFQGYPNELREDFDHLQQSLSLHDMANWVQNYKQEPTAWQPFKDSSGSIEQLINQVLFRIDNFQKRIIPDFIDIRTLIEEQKRDTLRKLRYEGCVVILDVISMQHPVIQHQFRRSLLDVFPTTIVARVAPVTDALYLEQRMIAVIEQRIEMEFYKRIHMDWDDKCQEISTPVDFARWLKNQVPKLLPDEIKVQTDSRKYWYRMNGG